MNIVFFLYKDFCTEEKKLQIIRSLLKNTGNIKLGCIIISAIKSNVGILFKNGNIIKAGIQGIKNLRSLCKFSVCTKHS